MTERTTGWHRDPAAPGTYRYWDGREWSGYATADEVRAIGNERPREDLNPNELDQRTGSPRCPHCGGTQFKARRTIRQRGRITVGWLTTGIGAASAARKHPQKVQCVTCGRFYDRIA